MAIVIQRIQVPTPTGLTATLQEGGTLPIGTTYYFRVVAFRTTYSGRNLLFHSAPTAEVSVTTTSTHRTVTLSWNAVENAFGYAVQRTTTSGSYPIDDSNTFTTSSGYFCLTTLTSLTDTGSRLWSGRNPCLDEEAPLIEVYATAGETIKSGNILQTAITNGWSNVRTPYPNHFFNASSAWKDGMPFSIFGSLYIHDCAFRWTQPIILLQGTFRSDNTVTFTNNYEDSPSLFTLNISVPRYTTDNNNVLSFGNSISMGGTGNISHLYWRRLITGASNVTVYYGMQYASGLGPMTVTGGFLAHNVMNQHLFSNANTIFDSVAFGNPVFRHGRFVGRLYVYATATCYPNASIQNMKLLSNNIFYQIFQDPGKAFIDCEFPDSYIVTFYQPSTTGNTHLFAYTLTVRVMDSGGSPIEGAQVEITNALGLPEGFTNTGIAFTGGLNETDNVSNWTVANGAVFNVGDVVRGFNYTELMQVIGKSGNTLTLQRGYLGTAKRWVFNADGMHRLVARLEPLITDANGVVRPTVPLVHLEYINIMTGSFIYQSLDWLEANGYIAKQVFTPHTIKVSKAGYRTWTGVVNMTRTTELVVVLHTVEEPPYPWEVWHG